MIFDEVSKLQVYGLPKGEEEMPPLRGVSHT
jgi:hypothetical protein